MPASRLALKQQRGFGGIKLATKMKRTVVNIDGIEKIFLTDQAFLEYAQTVYKENEEGQPYDSDLHWLPENVQQATEYIHEYCDNLELTEGA